MPTQSRGFFICDYCGLSCDTYEEARDHEMACPQRPPGSGDRRGPPPGHGPPPGYYGRGPSSQHHYGGPPPPSHEMEGYPPYGHHPHHEQHPPPGYGPPPPPGYGGKEMRGAIPLLGPHDRANLAMEDAIACQNIELFEATPEHAADHEQQQQQSGADQGAPPLVVTVKQVGLRCIHCVSKPPTDEQDSSSPSRSKESSGSVVFPGSLGSIAANVRMLADNHLRLFSTIPEVRDACGRAANKRRQRQQQRDGGNSNNNDEGGRNSAEDEEEEGSRLALLDFCVGFCQQLGIVNKQPHKTGIEFADAGGEMGHHYGGGHAAETPNGPREPPPHPYSADRMGPPPMSAERMGYPTPGGAPPPGHRPPPHAGGMIGGPGGEGIAPTPLQRRRDRPGGAGEMERRPPYSAESDRDRGPPSSGYPTPASFLQGGPPGSEPHYPGGPDGPGMQTPAQPNFEGEGQTPYSAHPSEAGGSPDYHDLPSNFPFFQERDGSWHCKFCCHIHPQYRDPQSIWTQSPGPPPGNFIDHHLSMCRAYHQSMPSPPMYQGPPPPYGPPHMGHPYGYGPPPGPWEGHSPPHGAGMHPSHYGQYPPGPPGEAPYGYAPPHHHPDHPPQPHRYPGHNEDPYGDPRSRGGPGGGGHIPMGPLPGESQPPDVRLPPNMPGTGIPGQLAVNPDGKPFKYPGITDIEGRLLPAPQIPKFAKENMGSDSVRNAINVLVAREQEYFARDPEARKLARLVLDEDRLLLTEYFFFLMKQLRLCRFTESDRKTRGGKREKIKIGYGGLQCIHCCDIPNSRKFFWSNVDRLANSFAEIPGHVLKCRRCPQSTRDAILTLKAFHPEQMARLPRGSQKVFFRRMWRRLHDEDPEDPDAPSSSTPTGASVKSDPDQVSTTEEGGKGDKCSPGGPKPVVSEESPTLTKTASNSPETTLVPRRTAKQAAAALTLAAEQNRPLSPTSRVVLAIPEDKEWLSDMDCFIRKQLEVFCANADDKATAQNDRKYPVFVGQVGIRCIHCSMGQGATGTAVAFPYAISQIYESVREFQRLHLDSCDQVPPAIKSKLATFKGSSSLSSVLRKYYIIAAKSLGLHDTREGIRPGGESIPLSNQAAFSFSDTNISMEADGEADENSNGEDKKTPTKGEEVGAASDVSKKDDEEQQKGDGAAEKTEMPATENTSPEKPVTGGDPDETESEKSDDVKADSKPREFQAKKIEESTDKKDDKREEHNSETKSEETKEEADAEKKGGSVDAPAEEKDVEMKEEGKADKQVKENMEGSSAEKKEGEIPSKKGEAETKDEEMKEEESEIVTKKKDEEMKEDFDDDKKATEAENPIADKEDKETETPSVKKEDMKEEEKLPAAANEASASESPTMRRSSPRRKNSPSKSTTATTMKPDDNNEENKKRPSDDEGFDRPAKKTRSQGGEADSKKDGSEVEEASV